VSYPDTTVTFRGEEREVVIDDVEEDPSVNFSAIEWHFDGMTPAEHDALNVTDAEESAILAHLWESVWDSRSGDD
jgi:hypothetical protein